MQKCINSRNSSILKVFQLIPVNFPVEIYNREQLSFIVLSPTHSKMDVPEKRQPIHPHLSIKHADNKKKSSTFNQNIITKVIIEYLLIHVNITQDQCVTWSVQNIYGMIIAQYNNYRVSLHPKLHYWEPGFSMPMFLKHPSGRDSLISSIFSTSFRR